MSGRFGKAARFCACRLTCTNAPSPYDKLPSKRNSTPVPHPGFRGRQLLCRGAPTHPRKRPGGPPAAPMCSVPLAGSTRAKSGKERLRKIILFGLLAMVSLAAAACAALRCGKPVSPGKPYGNPRRHARGNDRAMPGKCFPASPPSPRPRQRRRIPPRRPKLRLLRPKRHGFHGATALAAATSLRLLGRLSSWNSVMRLGIRIWA